MFAGLTWYRREDYPRVLDIMDDSSNLPRTYDAWLQQAEQAERSTQAGGVAVVRAILDHHTLPEWCAANGLSVNAKGRTLWVADFAQRSGKGQN